MKTYNSLLRIIALAVFNIGILTSVSAGNNNNNNNNIKETSVNTSSLQLVLGFENSPKINDSKTDGNNNTVITGQVLLSGYDNAFIAKVDANGNLLWKVVTGGSHYGNNSQTVTINTDGTYTIKGHYSAEAQFGSITLKGERRSYFVATFDANGTCISAEKVGVDIM